MKTSQRRILTTHSGSLPRPQRVREMLAARAAGDTVDRADFDEAVEESVGDLVRRQVEPGVDVIKRR